MSRSGLFGALVIVVALCATSARSQNDLLPPVGGVSSPEGAMIFYLAHGQDGDCGTNCSDWIAAEGTVEWDTFKRLFAFLERFSDRKMPVVLNVWGNGSLDVAMTLGKIIREHGLDVSVGATAVTGCQHATDAACFELKRSGQPLDAKIDRSFDVCDTVCVLILAGGVHRTLPADASVTLGGVRVRSRLAPNVSEERQLGLLTHFSDQYRLYLKQMGVNPEIVDIIDRNSITGRATRLSNKDWLRLGIVTGVTL